MVKYITGCYSWEGTGLITAREVERETESCVWVKGERRLKVTDRYRYFDTWEEAKEYLLATKRREVDSLQMRLDKARAEESEIEDLAP